ncbi:hypothetical protein EDC05_002756 [Coemansia umbellata]|uniref:Uncharacterized protein n=1 Tax=Coemansia umbellata TaxID=1424467 RepID=A0ABQ8PNB6_9FUNG|nr:hypothetical protein EDC05_002756 [Coemansia umbellata]
MVVKSRARRSTKTRKGSRKNSEYQGPKSSLPTKAPPPGEQKTVPPVGALKRYAVLVIVWNRSSKFEFTNTVSHWVLLFGIRVLRRTQSAVAYVPTKEVAASSSWLLETSNIDSGSESDLPDALSLLKTPEPQQRASKKRPLCSQNDLGGLPAKRSRFGLPSLLAKSPSETVPEDDDEELGGTLETKPLKVPGELVLAYSLRKYYPARVKEQISPKRYIVEFFDGSKAVLSKSRILTMYDSKFYTCSLGALQLIGDEPIKNTQKMVDIMSEPSVDPEEDFERDKRIFSHLVTETESIKDHLDALHGCTKENIGEMGKVEDRLSIFLGDNLNLKRLLPLRVSKGFLNRAEFDFLGRLLSRWYMSPPTASATSISNTPILSTQSGLRGSDMPEIQQARTIDTSLADLEASTLAIQFVHEVLLPHTIRRLIAKRENCTLDESEAQMFKEDSETHWVDQILAARGVWNGSTLSEPADTNNEA